MLRRCIANEIMYENVAVKIDHASERIVIYAIYYIIDIQPVRHGYWGLCHTFTQ